MHGSFVFEFVESVQLSVVFGNRFFNVGEALADILNRLVDCL